VVIILTYDKLTQVLIITKLNCEKPISKRI
jgi:hypothetical protein